MMLNIEFRCWAISAHKCFQLLSDIYHFYIDDIAIVLQDLLKFPNGMLNNEIAYLTLQVTQNYRTSEELLVLR